MAAKYRLGVVSQPLPGDEDYAGALSIPYLTRNGVASVKFRMLGDRKPKYLYHSGTKPRLYNPAAYFDADAVIGLAEGEIDAIVATEVIGLPTMGIPGVDTWKAQAAIWKPVFQDFESVILLADGDPVNEKTGLRPGRELGKAVKESLGYRARIVEMPEGEDVSSMVASGRADEIKRRVHGA